MVQIEELDNLLVELKREGDLSVEEISAIEDVKSNPINVQKELEEESGDRYDVRSMLRDLELPGKIKLALYGNSTCRALLIMESNKILQASVLKNPKLGINEVEDFAKNPNISQFVLRTISDKKEWLKSNIVKLNLVSNPKTPGDIALKWLRYLNETEIRKISKSKNVPNIIAQAAKKRIGELDKSRS